MRKCLVGLVLIGCAGSKAPDTASPPSATTPESMLDATSWSINTTSGGPEEVAIEIGPAVSAFMLTGDSRKDVWMERVVAPDGAVLLDWQDWWTSEESLTEAVLGYSSTTALNWPIRDVDPPLVEGTYLVHVSALGGNGDYTAGKIDLTLHTKRDPSLTTGQVHARVVYTGGVDNDPTVVTATEEAVERWREVWEMHGLTLHESYGSVPTIDADLGFWYSGDDALTEVATGLTPGSVVVYVGESVDGDFDTYGVAGGIPGTLTPSSMTYVVVSWLSHAGFDAQFTRKEKSMMGETMAHEVGHYMGLFHPVESSYAYWDALEDTPQCETWSRCEDELGSNLMFPYAICSGSDCVVTEDLTPNQHGVAHRYTGTQ
jgi:hypothetical protein